MNDMIRKSLTLLAEFIRARWRHPVYPNRTDDSSGARPRPSRFLRLTCRFRQLSPSCAASAVDYPESMAPVRALPNYLKTHRKRTGFTQKEFAFLLGCEHGSKVSRYERGERIPSLATFFAYELILGVSGRELFAGTYQRVAEEVRGRARELFKKLDEERFTPAVKQKLDSLAEVAHPPRSNRSNHAA